MTCEVGPDDSSSRWQASRTGSIIARTMKRFMIGYLSFLGRVRPVGGNPGKTFVLDEGYINLFWPYCGSSNEAVELTWKLLAIDGTSPAGRGHSRHAGQTGAARRRRRRDRSGTRSHRQRTSQAQARDVAGHDCGALLQTCTDSITWFARQFARVSFEFEIRESGALRMPQ